MIISFIFFWLLVIKGPLIFFSKEYLPWTADLLKSFNCLLKLGTSVTPVLISWRVSPDFRGNFPSYTLHH